MANSNHLLILITLVGIFCASSLDATTIGVFLNGSPFRATFSMSSRVSWCSKDVADQLGLKINKFPQLIIGTTTMGEEIMFVGTVKPLLQLSPVIGTTNIQLYVGNVPGSMVCLSGSFDHGVPKKLHFSKVTMGGGVLLFDDHPCWELVSDNPFRASPTIFQLSSPIGDDDVVPKTAKDKLMPKKETKTNVEGGDVVPKTAKDILMPKKETKTNVEGDDMVPKTAKDKLI